jgi:S-methylmethionine-dependent homocysteine/selenocysteine methylase
MLEMMRDVTQTRLCLEAALETGLPVWLGFSVERSPDGELFLFGSQTPFKEGLDRVLDGAGTVGGCCGIRPAHIAALRAAIGQA